MRVEGMYKVIVNRIHTLTCSDIPKDLAELQTFVNTLNEIGARADELVSNAHELEYSIHRIKDTAC